jgi:hypothetical protein
MAKAYDLINSNIENLCKLQKIGINSLTTLTDYQTIYSIYLGFSNIKENTLRVQYTAEKSKVSTAQVYKIINVMQKNI